MATAAIKATATTVAMHGDAVVLPPELIKQYGLEDGSILVIDLGDDGITLRPTGQAVEVYTPERKAEFLLTNAMDDEEYVWARGEVQRMGLDPDAILHYRPGR